MMGFALLNPSYPAIDVKMTNYRRNLVKGGSYFFTVNLADRSSHLLVERVDLLGTAIRYVKTRHPFRMNAIVVLPDHLHAIFTLPDGDQDYALRWRLIKSYFSRKLTFDEPRSKSRIDKGERGIWQRRYWEHTLRDEADIEQHVAYIHFNPVKHGHVKTVSDWQHSSFHRYVRLGLLAADWAGGQGERQQDFGEG